LKLTILFGGASFEHEISIVSAITLKEKLSTFELNFIFCDTDHKFYLINAEKMKATTFSSGAYKKMAQLHITNGAFIKKTMFSTVSYNDKVLNLIHGADGEDGSIAALLEFFSIPFIGPRVDASVFSFDKRYTKSLALARDVKTLSYEILYKNDKKDITTSYPFIIKPSRLGSSIGVSIVKEKEQLAYALDTAFEFDDCVIIEPFIAEVKEYNLAGYMANGEIHYSIIEEPQKEEFLDFEKKYMDFSRSKQILEANIDKILEEKLKEAFYKIYKNLFEGALIRCDFFVIDNEVYLNEINPIPGSMANYLFENFEQVLQDISLPSKKNITTNYEYIHSISSAKGK